MRTLIATVIILYAMIMHAAFAVVLEHDGPNNGATRSKGKSPQLDGSDRRLYVTASKAANDSKIIKKFDKAYSKQSKRQAQDSDDPVDNASDNAFDVSDYDATVNVTSGSKLNVRSGSGTNHAIIGSRFTGDKLRVTHHDGQWRRIAWSGGQVAYVHGDFLQNVDSDTKSDPLDNPLLKEANPELSQPSTKPSSTNHSRLKNDPTYSRLRAANPELTQNPKVSTSTGISTLSDYELQQRIDNWQGSDNDPILDRLVSEQNARLDVPAPALGSDRRFYAEAARKANDPETLEQFDTDLKAYNNAIKLPDPVDGSDRHLYSMASQRENDPAILEQFDANLEAYSVFKDGTARVFDDYVEKVMSEQGHDRSVAEHLVALQFQASGVPTHALPESVNKFDPERVLYLQKHEMFDTAKELIDGNSENPDGFVSMSDLDTIVENPNSFDADVVATAIVIRYFADQPGNEEFRAQFEKKSLREQVKDSPWLDPDTDSIVVNLLLNGGQSQAFRDRIIEEGPGALEQVEGSLHELSPENQAHLAITDREQLFENYGSLFGGAKDWAIDTGKLGIGVIALSSPPLALAIEKKNGTNVYQEAFNMAGSAVETGLNDPDQLAKSIVGWEQFIEDPYRWAGNQAPDIILEILGTKGAGKFAKLARGRRASRPLSKIPSPRPEDLIRLDPESTTFTGVLEADAARRGGDWAKLSGQLRDAAKGKGNFGIGSGSREQAASMGKAWVGNGSKVASDGKTLVSKDGLRQYRPPSYKPRLDKTQANFEQRFPGQKSNRWQSNGHLDITD